MLYDDQTQAVKISHLGTMLYLHNSIATDGLMIIVKLAMFYEGCCSPVNSNDPKLQIY